MKFLSKLFSKNAAPQAKKTEKRTIGDIGEDIACEYLRSKGYKIIERNAQISHKEIDIVAENEEYTVIVEVKTLSITEEQAQIEGRRPSDSIDRAKAQNVLYAASAWCSKHYSGRSPRVDVIEIYLGNDVPRVVHIENAINSQTLYRKRR